MIKIQRVRDSRYAGKVKFDVDIVQEGKAYGVTVGTVQHVATSGKWYWSRYGGRRKGPFESRDDAILAANNDLIEQLERRLVDATENLDRVKHAKGATAADIEDITPSWRTFS